MTIFYWHIRFNASRALNFVLSSFLEHIESTAPNIHFCAILRKAHCNHEPSSGHYSKPNPAYDGNLSTYIPVPPPVTSTTFSDMSIDLINAEFMLKNDMGVKLLV